MVNLVLQAGSGSPMLQKVSCSRTVVSSSYKQMLVWRHPSQTGVQIAPPRMIP